MKDFDSWFKELVSDQIWSAPAQLHHRPETFKKVAHRVYMSCVADGVFKPIGEARKHVYNILCNTPHDNKKVDWAAKALDKIEKEDWQPVSPEKRAEYLEKLQAIIKGSTMISSAPKLSHKQEVEEGGWIPKKGPSYPMTTLEEAYVRQRHLEYIKANYEPRTGQKIPDFIEEEEFNRLYDEGLT